MLLGDFEIAPVRTATYWWDGGALFGVVPKTLWSRKTEADELNRIPLGFNSYVVRTGSHTVLIETGCGDKMDARSRARMKLAPEPEDLREALAAAGVDPDSVDIVINSHLHWDHCGGNTVLRAGQPAAAFPRARYFAPHGEWEHAHRRLARDAVSYIDANYDPLVESGQMTLVEGDCEIVPGIRMRPAPGHNRDMCVVTAESAGAVFCFLADLVPTAAHLQPTWVAAFDLYPLETIEQKTKWLGAAADAGWVCGFSHDPRLAFARIQRDARTGFALHPE
jgi:glyoxylase-like metal-dependent hydrolase (beta-lactamase superfamily II)